MIRKQLLTFDAHSQTCGFTEVRFVGEEMLAEKRAIQIVNSFFCRLPFRLRLGFRAAFQIGGIIPARIVVTNPVDIPNVEVQRKLLGDPPHVRPEFASNVLITVNPVKLKDDAKASISMALDNSDYSKAIANLHTLHINVEDILKPLNKLIVRYLVLFGKDVQWNRVQRMLRKDFCGGNTFNLHIFQHKQDSVDFQQIEDCIADATPTSPTPFQLGGNFFDIPAESITELQDSLRKNRDYAFYSLAIQAQDYIKQTDYLNALLYSVIAFENAHAEFIEHIAETKASSKKARKWMQTLLQQAGISAILPLTPSLFMDPENRPSEETVKGVVRAIGIRNELAHAKRDRSQNLKVEAHRSHSLLPLIEAVFTYINTIARQLPD